MNQEITRLNDLRRSLEEIEEQTKPQRKKLNDSLPQTGPQTGINISPMEIDDEETNIPTYNSKDMPEYCVIGDYIFIPTDLPQLLNIKIAPFGVVDTNPLID